jgi:hypothetical protein
MRLGCIWLQVTNTQANLCRRHLQSKSFLFYLLQINLKLFLTSGDVEQASEALRHVLRVLSKCQLKSYFCQFQFSTKIKTENDLKLTLMVSEPGLVYTRVLIVIFIWPGVSFHRFFMIAFCSCGTQKMLKFYQKLKNFFIVINALSKSARVLSLASNFSLEQ